MYVDAENVKKDLLGNLMSAVDEETGEGLSNKQLRDQIMSLLVAGHEVINIRASLLIYHMSQPFFLTTGS